MYKKKIDSWKISTIIVPVPPIAGTTRNKFLEDDV